MAREQRRLAAVLAADAVGYSRLMGRDEAGTLDRLRAHRRDRLEPIVGARGGRIVKLTGDGVLAEFPSAVDALSSAIEFQQAMRIANAGEADDRVIVFRIGLHLGDLIVDGADLYGDGVNIAARLEAEAPPGGVVVSRSVHDAVVRRLKAEFTDLGQLALKNIELPQQAYRVEWEAADWPSLRHVAADASQAGTAQDWSAMPALPDKPSIAVLPFNNMSGDAEQEYFADGMVEDITTALSHIRWLFVIARNSSFIYKGRAVDLKQVGRELGVRYVLEGSVRRAGNRLRITAQLIEAATGVHVWAERYDRTIEDMFAIQDEITSAVVGTIEPVLAETERQRAASRPPGNLGTWELYHRGLLHFYKFTAEDNTAAGEFLLRATQRDPSFTLARSALAFQHLMGGWLFSSHELAKWSQSGREHGRVAIGLDPADGMAHAIYGIGLMMTGDHDAAVRETTQGIELHPNNAMTQGAHADALSRCGRAAESLAFFAQAIRFSPRDPLRWWRLFSFAVAQFHTGDYAASVATSREVCHLQPNHYYGYRTLLAALAAMDRMDEARQCADIIHTRFAREMTAFLSTRWPQIRQSDYDELVASLEKGGVGLRDGVLARTG